MLYTLETSAILFSNARGTYLDHGENFDALLSIVLSNVLRSQETDFLCRVPVKLYGTHRTEALVDESTENFQGRDRA